VPLAQADRLDQIGRHHRDHFRHRDNPKQDVPPAGQLRIGARHRITSAKVRPVPSRVRHHATTCSAGISAEGFCGVKVQAILSTGTPPKNNRGNQERSSEGRHVAERHNEESVGHDDPRGEAMSRATRSASSWISADSGTPSKLDVSRHVWTCRARSRLRAPLRCIPYNRATCPAVQTAGTERARSGRLARIRRRARTLLKSAGSICTRRSLCDSARHSRPDNSRSTVRVDTPSDSAKSAREYDRGMHPIRCSGVQTVEVTTLRRRRLPPPPVVVTLRAVPPPWPSLRAWLPR